MTRSAPAVRARESTPSEAAARPLRIIVNGSFRGQRVTGQQRYASELTAALQQLPLPAGWRLEERHPPRSISTNRVLTYLWTQSLAFTPRRSVLLSLTSRAPFFARNHVVAIHDNFVLTHPEWYRRSYRWSHASLQRWHMRTARSLIAVSAPVAEEVRRIRGSDDVAVVPNAPAAAFALEPDESEVGQAVLAASAHRSYFLAVGTLDPRKNLRRLLRAYGRLPEAQRRQHPLLLVGDSGHTFARDGDSRTPDGAVHLGYVNDVELAHLYRNALATVFVSLDEGFGLPAVEALSCGTALIASDIPVFRWVCGDAPSYVDPTSEDDIVRALGEAIAAAAAEPGTRRQARGAHEQFTWQRSAEALLASLVGEPGPARHDT